MEAPGLTDDVLTGAGVVRAAALALVHDDDETNIHAALRARRRGPRLRLVIRLYNRKLGQHLEELLDQAAAVAGLDMDPAELDAATTVLSDADTVAPALAATAVAGTRKVVQADGLLLRAAERTPPGHDQVAHPGICTLALLSSTTSDPGGSEGSDSDGDDGPHLLPDDADVAAATGRGTVVLEAVSYTGRPLPPRRLGSRSSAITVERTVLLFAALRVAGHPQLEDRTVAEAFRPGAWRVIALDAADPADRLRDLAATLPYDGTDRESGLVWDLHPGYVLRPHDRVVLATTRQGLGELLGGTRP